MDQFSARDQKIFEDMKKCFKESGLRILDEKSDKDTLSGISIFDYPGYTIEIMFSYDNSYNVAELGMHYANLPAEKLPALYELLNHINNNLAFNHFFIDPGTRILTLRSGFYVTEYFLNKKGFKMLLRQNLGIGHTFMPLIGKLISKNQTPRAIMEEFDARKKMTTPDFFGPDGKVKKPEIVKEQPFIIHGCTGMPTFPTHSHGMTDLGMPEFLINHWAFGMRQNGGIIGASYRYFIKPENALKLDAIKNGETAKLTIVDLKPDAVEEQEDLVFCYRRVYPEFEMVKQAYCIDDPREIDSKTWFVQIYVEGDDFALTDEYYRDDVQ